MNSHIKLKNNKRDQMPIEQQHVQSLDHCGLENTNKRELTQLLVMNRVVVTANTENLVWK